MEITANIKEPGSAITHGIALIMAGMAALPLLLKAAAQSDRASLYCMLIFILSMILLYGASTAYHTFDISEKVNRVLKKLDHSAIFVLIAGTYTPICLITLEQPVGRNLCIAVWSIAAAGILVKLLWINCPKWFSSILYISMGWVCVGAMSTILRDLSKPAFLWLLAGGLIYTAGGVIYALKLPLFDEKHTNFGTHEIFHLFVMAGSLCHFVLMYAYIL